MPKIGKIQLITRDCFEVCCYDAAPSEEGGL